MDLTRREKSSLICNVVCLIISIVLIFSFDLISSLIFPSGSDLYWGYMKYLLILIIVTSVIMIIWIAKPRKLTPHIIEGAEIQEETLTQELKQVGIVPNGQVLMIIEKLGYSDPLYARKSIRKWPWRDKGKVVLTDKELIFLGKRDHFFISLSDILAIQPFTARGGIRTFQVCEIVYGDFKDSVVFMGTIGFRTFDMPSEIELKSMKLMKTFQKWYDSWSKE